MRILFIVLSFIILSGLTSPPVLVATQVEKEFGGIGAQVVPTATGEIVVLQIVSGAPAEKNGLLPGDLIVKIDNILLRGLDFKTVTREYLWGFVGEPVHVNWLRPGDTVEREADLVRVKIDQNALRHPDVKMIEPKQ